VIKVEFKSIIYEKADGIAKITFNKPDKLNAADIAFLTELLSALEDAERDENVKVVIITGSGRAFSAGMDLSMFKEGVRAYDFSKIMELGHKVTRFIENMSKPVIAAVNGYALGGGCEIALACDLTIAADTASFGQPEINLAFYPSWGGTQRLTRLIGYKKAKELILLGDRISAEEAYRLGIVNAVVPADKLMEKAMEYAKKLASKSPIALKVAKRLVNSALETNLEAGLRMEVMQSALFPATDDFNEGLKAFFEKRQPEFKGR